VDANTADDKEFLAVGPDFANLAQDRFYIGWQRGNNLFVSSSTNGSVWSAPVQVNDNAANRGIVSQMAVGPNGELHYAWQTSTDAFGSRVLMDTSPDGGVTWGADQLIATTDISLCHPRRGQEHNWRSVRDTNGFLRRLGPGARLGAGAIVDGQCHAGEQCHQLFGRPDQYE